MNHTLRSRRLNAPQEFQMDNSQWPYLLQFCGLLYPFLINGSDWYTVWGVDRRLGKNGEYPKILDNSGFYVKYLESRQISKFCSNFVRIQNALPSSHYSTNPNSITQILPTPWPCKIRQDWVESYREFVDWAERSGGFWVY